MAKQIQMDFRTKWVRRFDSDPIKNTPEAPGVYMFVELDLDKMTKEIVYIGKSSCLQNRLCDIKHVTRLVWQIDVLKSKRNAFLLTYYKVTYDFEFEEIRLIKRLFPRLNTQYNTSISKVKPKYNFEPITGDPLMIFRDYDGEYKYMKNVPENQK